MTTYLFLRLDFASGASFGPGRAAILEGIDQFGSISAAARAVDMTYRQVWATVKDMNESFKAPLVDIRAGGRNSGATLTPLGKEVLTHYRGIARAADRALNKRLSALAELLGEDPNRPAPVPRSTRRR